MFYKCELRSRMQLPEVYFIHEGTDKKDSATRSTEQIFRCEGVREPGGVQPFSLV